MAFRGEWAALTAALFWAIASFLYARLGKQMPAIWLNWIKSSIAVGLIGLTLLLRPDAPPQIGFGLLGLLGLSGAIGIGLGDSLFFAALRDLGARRALLLEAISPPLAAVLALLFLQERLALAAWVGIFLTVGGVSWVIAERQADQAEIRLRHGVGLGLLAVLAQAIGAVLSRAALLETSVSPLWSSLIRLMAGALLLLPYLLVKLAKGPVPPQSSSINQSSLFSPLRSGQFLLRLGVASVLGTYLGIWLQQTALKFTATGIAQALIATSPLFSLPIAVMMGERVSGRAVLGAVVALAGVWLLFAAGSGQ